MPNNDIYYKLYLNRDSQITVVCMQSFDEPDYNRIKFLVGEDGDPVMFETEEEAVVYLNKHFLRATIDPEYVTPNNRAFLKDTSSLPRLFQ